MRLSLLVLLLPLAAWADGATGFTLSADTALLSEPNGKPTGSAKAGQRFELLKRGGPEKAWCKLKTPSGAGWVPCSAGADARGPAAARGDDAPRKAKRDRDEPAGSTRRGDSAAAPSGCLSACAHEPLFRAMPELTATDREILALCPARPDVSVAEAEVRRFFAAHYDDPRLQRALSIAGRPGNKEQNLSWLTSLWVSTGPKNAFTHVFCGDDWTKQKLGGLHFLPRYAQLESEGKVCFGGAAKGSAKKGGQYLIRYKGVWPWSCGDKPMGGFPERHDPVELVSVATRAFARCCDRGGKHGGGGVYEATDAPDVKWRIWCGERNGTYGIDSMYPTDERPTCRD